MRRSGGGLFADGAAGAAMGCGVGAGLSAGDGAGGAFDVEGFACVVGAGIGGGGARPGCGVVFGERLTLGRGNPDGVGLPAEEIVGAGVRTCDGIAGGASDGFFSAPFGGGVDLGGGVDFGGGVDLGGGRFVRGGGVPFLANAPPGSISSISSIERSPVMSSVVLGDDVGFGGGVGTPVSSLGIPP